MNRLPSGDQPPSQYGLYSSTFLISEPSRLPTKQPQPGFESLCPVEEKKLKCFPSGDGKTRSAASRTLVQICLVELSSN